MNKQRRKAISEPLEQLEAIKSQIEDLKGEEEEYLENMQEGEKGQRASEVIDNLTNAA